MSAPTHPVSLENNACAGSRHIWRYAVILIAASEIAFLVGAAGYIRVAPNFLARLGMNVGEVLMKEALRFEKAGAVENAKEHYLRALDARFAGEQNRIYTLRRLGGLYLNEGSPMEAVKYLRQVIESPTPSLAAFEPLVAAYYQLNQFDEAERVLKQWEQAAVFPDTATKASFCFHAGRIARARGDLASAFAKFQEGMELSPESANASELGLLYFDQGKYQEAVAAMEQYLNSGGSGDRAQYARQIRERALKKLNEQGK